MRRSLFLCPYVALLLSLFLSTSRVVAQDEGSTSETPDEQEVVPRTQLTESGERIIYIPFKDFGETFDDPESNIVLPYSEYQTLLAAWRSAQTSAKSPQAVISSASYAVKIDGEIARIQVKLKVNVLGDSWSQLPVRFGEAAVGRVTGEDVLLRGIGDGQYALLFKDSGEKTVELELATRVLQSPEGQEFSFETPPVAVTTLDVTVPKKDQAIEVVPKIVELTPELNPEPGDDSTQLKANVGATNRITVKWHPEASLKPEMSLLASVTNHTLVNMEDGLVHTDTYLDYDILRGSMDQCRVVVPSDHRILDVSASARIKSWQTVEQDGNQIVEVEFLSAVEKPVRLEVHTERKLDEEEFEAAGWNENDPAHGIHALDVVRESGQIAIRHAADYTLTVVDQEGVVRIESGTVDKILSGANALTFKFYAPNLSLTLSAKPVQPRLMVGHQMFLTFQDDELQVENTLQYTVERAGVFELRLVLPAGLVIDDVVSPQMKEFNIDEQASELAITLLERTQGTIPVQIRSHLSLDETVSQLQLPLIEPLGVERETGSIFVFAKDAIEVITEQDGLQGVQPLPANGVRRGNATLNSAWSFSRRPLVIPVRTVRKPTRLSARIGTTIEVQPELTQIRTQLDYLIEYSGIETFRFEVPESVSELIQIETQPGDQSSAPIKQRTAAEAVDGWVTWTVITQREVLGRQRFVVTYDAPKAGQTESDATEEPETSEPDANADANLTKIELFRPLGLIDDQGNTTTALSDLQGEVLVQKERSLAISADATGGDVEVIDLRELKFLPQTGTLAFRYFSSAADNRISVSLSQSRHDIQEVVATVVSRGLVEVVTGEDAEGTYRCRFLVKTTERQRLLVYLPASPQVLGTFLNDREVQLEKADLPEFEVDEMSWTPFWVNVARTESSDQQFLLTFQFLWNINPPLGASTFGRGMMSLPLPIVGEKESKVIQELKVAVWVPEKYALVGDPSEFHLQKSSRPGSLLMGELAERRTNQLESWVSQGLSFPAGVAQFPTEGRVPYLYTNLGGAERIEVKWWNRVKMSLIISIAIGLIGWILVRTTWENKLGMLLIAGFVAALYGLADSHALSQGIYAARFGIVLLLGLWLIHAFFQVSHMLNPSAISTSPGASAMAEPVPVDVQTDEAESASNSTHDSSETTPES